jgi:hypothetical protein
MAARKFFWPNLTLSIENTVSIKLKFELFINDLLTRRRGNPILPKPKTKHFFVLKTLPYCTDIYWPTESHLESPIISTGLDLGSPTVLCYSDEYDHHKL